MRMSIFRSVFQELNCCASGDWTWDGWNFYMGRLVGMDEGFIAGLGGEEWRVHDEDFNHHPIFLPFLGWKHVLTIAQSLNKNISATKTLLFRLGGRSFPQVKNILLQALLSQRLNGASWSVLVSLLLLYSRWAICTQLTHGIPIKVSARAA